MSKPWHRFYPEGAPFHVDLPEMSLYEMLTQSEADYPEMTAVIDGDRELTYAQLRNVVDRFATGLYRNGFRKGARLGLMLLNGLEYIIAYYAVQRLGGIVVQINPMYQLSELSYILNDSETEWIVCEAEQKAKFAKLGLAGNLRCIFTDSSFEPESYYFDDLMADEEIELPPLDIDPREDIALLQYTGGTTGQSKGVMLTHYNLIGNLVQAYTFADGVFERPGEKMLAVSPFFHVYGMNVTLNLTIYLAGTVICVQRFKPDLVLELINKHQPTYFPGVPTIYIALLQHPDFEQTRLDSIKICTSGSAPLPLEIMHKFEQATGSKIIEGYGLTETSPVTHRNPIRGLRKPGSIGIPIQNTDSKIVDLETGTRELPVGEPGELIVKGPQVMKGYWKQPEETSRTIRDGWLYTGDVAKMDEDGYFYIVGRKKEMIIAGGLNVYPNEVEEVLYQHPAVAEACVYGVPDEYLGETVKAVIVLGKQESATKEELLDWCRERLARYKVPRLVEFRDHLPKTMVGKILRRTLVEQELNRMQAQQNGELN